MASPDRQGGRRCEARRVGQGERGSLREGGMTGEPPRVLPISAIVLTHNEERNLPKCLDSIAGRVSEIIIVDSFSTDSTLQVAKSYTDKIVQHEYAGHPQQWHWTLASVATA